MKTFVLILTLIALAIAVFAAYRTFELNRRGVLIRKRANAGTMSQADIEDALGKADNLDHLRNRQLLTVGAALLAAVLLTAPPFTSLFNI